MGSCAAPSAKGDDKFITTDYLQQCQKLSTGASGQKHRVRQPHFRKDVQQPVCNDYQADDPEILLLPA
ncbi:hypothetical protein ACV8TM_28185, partial [Citrobacter freundii]